MISSDAFSVSRPLVDQAVRLEELMRGIGTELADPIDDGKWDRIEDFHLPQIRNFLLSYSWKLEWIDSSISLIWDSNTEMFSLNDTARSLTRSRFGLAPTWILPMQNYSLPPSSNIGVAGGMLCLFGLSTVLVLVVYGRLHRGVGSIMPPEVLRSLGMSDRSKEDHQSPKDVELGRDDSDGGYRGRTGSIERKNRLQYRAFSESSL